VDEPLPDALAALVAQLQRAGFSAADDASRGWAFRQVVLINPDRSFGGVVKLTKVRGLWGVEIAIKGDELHGPYEVLLALDGSKYMTRAMSHEEERVATLEALDRMPESVTGIEVLRARLREYREEYTGQMSGRRAVLTEARRSFDAGNYRSAVEAYERLRDDELSRADQARLEIARRRIQAS
jgi:hypothetical protein